MNTAYQFGSLNGDLVPSFSAYNFLRHCSYFPETPSQATHLKSFRETLSENSKFIEQNERSFIDMLPKHILTQNDLLAYSHPLQLLQRDPIGCRLSLDRSVSPAGSSNFKKQRSEKRPIPEEQKDDKYFERRRRNNQAAKKSRDARKMREDQIALKATILEHENAILRAQVLTLREETTSLKQMLLHRKPFEMPARDEHLCVITQ